MSDTDFKQRFLFPDTDIRGELVRLDDSITTILGERYPMVVQGLVGEAVAAVALLAGTLKFQGRLSLQAQGQGPVSLLLAECTHDGRVRALARHEDNPDPGDGNPVSLIGDGTMVITITPDQGRRYQGIVPLEGDSLAQCLEGYFRQSEQLPTRLWLAAGNGRAAGLMLQRLPNQVASADQNVLQWEHLEALAGTLQMEELLDLDAETVLRRLFHDTPPRLPERQALAFGCTCSRERTRNALLSLGAEELRRILDEDGATTLTCDFCHAEEHFDAVDLAALLRELS